MIQRPIGQSHTDDCFDTDEYHRCDACRQFGLPIDDRDERWLEPATDDRTGGEA